MPASDGFEGRGATEVISLRVAYTEAAENVELVLGFDAFGDGLPRRHREASRCPRPTDDSP
jgi:hypothetical protein